MRDYESDIYGIQRPAFAGGDKIEPGDTPTEVPPQQPDEVPPDQV